MPCTVFGIANHSPEDVVSMLLKSRLAKQASDIGILPPSAKADPRFKYLLILSSRDFVRNLLRLRDTNVKVFVFSNPISLSTFSGIHPLDYSIVDDFTFRYFDIDSSVISKSKPQEIGRLKHDFLPRLIKNVKHGSLLNPLMTFIYSLSAQNQNKVKTASVLFLYHGHSPKKLAESVSTCLTERAIEKLLSILTTSIAQTYSTALQYIKMQRKQRKAIVIEDIAKTMSVSAYELSYMLSVLEGKQSFTDSFDKAKNRRSKPKAKA